MKDEVLTSSLTKKATVTCVNQFFMLCSKKVFMPCFIEYLGDIFWWNASTVFRPDFRNPTSPWIVFGPCCINARSKPTLQPRRGSPWRWRWRKARRAQRFTTYEVVENLIIFVEFLTQGVVIQVCTFVMILWLTPLKFNPSVDYSTSMKQNIDSRKETTLIGQISSQCI